MHFSVFQTKASGLGHHSGAALDEFGVGELHVHHPISLDVAQLDHRGGGQAIQDELGGGAGFHAGGASHKLGSRVATTGWSQACTMALSGLHVTHPVSKPRFRACRKAPMHVRCSTTRRNAHDGVQFESMLWAFEVFPSLLRHRLLHLPRQTESRHLHRP